MSRWARAILPVVILVASFGCSSRGVGPVSPPEPPHLTAKSVYRPRPTRWVRPDGGNFRRC
jgi:hypothetical protein